MAPEPSPAQVKADKFKKQIKENDAEFLDKYMQQGYEQARPGKYTEKGEKIGKMLEIVRQTIDKSLREKEDLGWIHADEVAKTVTREQVIAWMKRHSERLAIERRDKKWEGKSKDELIKDAYDLSRGSLAATLKRARMLTSKKITMDDVKKWRLENTNKEKKTDRKNFNSWVANKGKEEYQVDLFFFQDLKKKLAMKELLEERAKGGQRGSKGGNRR